MNNIYRNTNGTARKWLFGILTSLPLGGLGWALASCSDWDDHYDANQMVAESQRQTLWQNIETRSDLSQFAQLARKAGYDQVLSSPQTFTVWAPLNGTFDFDALSAYSSERLSREFIQNHVARNNYPATGAVDERVFMLNEKLMLFGGSGNYNVQGIALNEANVASSNGTLHTVASKIPFMANIYESLNSEQFAIDSISNYFHGYDMKELNEEKSVQGPTLNGQITYLDTIFDETNTLYQVFNAFINREDSNYTMILPTNEAWRRARNTIRSMYHYLPSFEFMENTSTTDKKVTTVTLKDADFLTDSMTNMALASGLFYNNNMFDNKRLSSLQEGQTLQCDSLMSTTFTKIYSEDAATLFQGTRRVDKSNGAIFVTDDSLRMHTWTAWNPELRQEAESNLLIAGVFNASASSPQAVYVSDANQNPAVSGEISGSRYIEVQPSASNTNPEIDFYLRNVRSTTYSVYAVIVPANIINASRETLPHRMIITMGYCDESGKTKETRLRNPVDSTTYFVNDPTKIDTLSLGDFTFPVAFVGTGSSSQSYYPYIRIRSSVTNALSADYDRTLRIDRIILRPKELDDYLKTHTDYKYDDGTY